MNLARSIGIAAGVFFLALGSAGARGAEIPAADAFGLLVMAHGGSPEWNKAVLDAVEPLRDRYPFEVAFGMADACSIQEGIRALEARGVRKVGVVRLFVSGESWYERTEQILGVRDGAPTASSTAEAKCGDGHHGSSHHSMALFRIATQSSFALSTQGMAETSDMGAILVERARSLSRAPEKEDVLILAHGTGDDAENERLLASLEARAAELRQSQPFHLVEVITLREDWPEKRKAAEQRIRAFITGAASEGRQAIVLPFRLYGFGPYAQVLEGLDYLADRQGLLPHANVTAWISRQAEELRAGPFRTPQR